MNRRDTLAWTTSFTAGGALMGVEILAGRLFFPFFGNTVYVWGALISVLLAGLGLGNLLGGRLADGVNPSRSTRMIARLMTAAGILLLLVPYYGLFLCRLISDWRLDPRFGSLTAAILVFLVPCALIGTLTPMLVKRAADKLETVGSKAGSIYAAATFGSIAGTLLTSFFLVAWVGTARGTQLCAVVLLVMSLPWWLPSRERT